jgi:hypothetical protein
MREDVNDVSSLTANLNKLVEGGGFAFIAF